MRTRTTALMALALGSLLLGTAGTSHAATGTVSGTLRFYNNQGNYCPTTRNCTAAQYLQSEYQVNLPVKDVKVYLVRTDGVKIGQGVSDSKGNFVLGWSSATTPVDAQIQWYGEHKDNRFRITAPDGGKPLWYTGFKRVASGGATSFGTPTWGSATGPNARANLYDGAWRGWVDSLNLSARMQTYFTNVEIRGFDAAQCPTSCAQGANKRILIDSADSAYRPQARVLHEMGHIGSYLSHKDQRFRACVDYSRDGVAGWTQTSPEHACAAFEEAFATFVGDRAIYGASNPAPHTCNSSGVCTTGNTEARPTTGCATGENRWALTINRYLRDLYDINSNETFDAIHVPFQYFFDTLYRLPSGEGEGQKDEPWSGSTRDDLDGRSTVDFRRNVDALRAINSGALLTNNCNPVGD